MEEQFATYEIALELKELGFNGPCLCYYDKNKILCRSLLEYPIINSKNGFHAHWNIITAPLWQQVIDWFREKYNIHIEITHHVTEQYDINYKYYVVKNPVDGIECYKNAYYKTYEKVREQAILKAIELINKTV